MAVIFLAQMARTIVSFCSLSKKGQDLKGLKKSQESQSAVNFCKSKDLCQISPKPWTSHANVCPGFEPCWAIGDKELLASLHWPGFGLLDILSCYEFEWIWMFIKNEALEFWSWWIVAWRQVNLLSLCLKVQKRPTNLRPCSRRCSHAKSVLGSWEMSEKSCLTLRVAISVRCRELQERQDRHGYTKKLYDVIMMYTSVNLNFFEQKFQSSFLLSSQKKNTASSP